MGEATAAMNDAFDFHQKDETGPTLDELVSSLNADLSRVFNSLGSVAHSMHVIIPDLSAYMRTWKSPRFDFHLATW